MLLTQRYYDGGVGRFVSEDGRRSGHHWFLYGSVRPGMVTDPEGLDCQPAIDYWCNGAPGPTGSTGKRKAIACACKVATLICNRMVRGRGGRGCLCSFFLPEGCKRWLECMGNCIKDTYPTLVSMAEGTGFEFEVRPDSGVKKSLKEWCADEDSQECCYAHSVLEKMALKHCRDSGAAAGGCAHLRHVTTARNTCHHPTGMPVDCANVLSNLTSMSDALPEWLGFGDPAFPYDGSLNEMIRASNAACCHSGWPVK